MTYEDFNDLVRRTTSDKILRNKTFNITKNPKYDRYQRGQKAMFQIGLKQFLRIKKLKTLCHGHMLLVILTGIKLLECFAKKNFNKQN